MLPGDAAHAFKAAHVRAHQKHADTARGRTQRLVLVVFDLDVKKVQAAIQKIDAVQRDSSEGVQMAKNSPCPMTETGNTRQELRRCAPGFWRGQIKIGHHRNQHRA